MAEAEFSAGCADAPGDVKGPGLVGKAGKGFSGPGVVAARWDEAVSRKSDTRGDITCKIVVAAAKPSQAARQRHPPLLSGTSTEPE
ncbi:hypothetical protein HPB52_021358 [Rhipicephalus sanguineus]|uniref:Uncharacterized protein n=1 Tax=Rhipicephalus sanguineus TaxID=34632 RepID=A0A9D4PMW6_RHISA|nr:hypothetical protein HPB52_021358 [Rhipicephalus sanguineus]